MRFRWHQPYLESRFVQCGGESNWSPVGFDLHHLKNISCIFVFLQLVEAVPVASLHMKLWRGKKRKTEVKISLLLTPYFTDRWPWGPQVNHAKVHILVFVVHDPLRPQFRALGALSISSWGFCGPENSWRQNLLFNAQSLGSYIQEANIFWVLWQNLQNKLNK